MRDQASVRVAAAHDERFLDYDAQRIIRAKSLTGLYDILDLTTALLNRLQSRVTSPVNPKEDPVKPKLASADLKCERSRANLEHLLLCLQQAAISSLVYDVLKLVATDLQQWYERLHQNQQSKDGRFADWPDGQRPLSTTMPWTIKPSLVVLWGVCWMFYYHNARVNQPQEEAQPQQDLGGPLATQARTRTPRTQRKPDSVAILFSSERITNIVVGWADVGAWAAQNINNAIPVQDSSSWPDLPVNDHTRHASNRESSRGQMTCTSFRLNVLSAELSDYYSNPLPGYSSRAPIDPYEPTYSTVSSDVLPASITATSAWPYNSGSNISAYASDYNTWQPQPLPATSQILAPSIETTDLSTDLQPYEPLRQPAPSRTDSYQNPGLGLWMRDMHDYPSPHSEVSNQASSPCLSIIGGTGLSPNMPYAPSSTSAGESPHSIHSGRDRKSSSEPGAPRNDQGLLICTRTECLPDTPTFQRKCEWTKHMDKHNRPYNCSEPGCENIRGFTYSGGLLRHQREVHRQHGGPKASCYCPHPDCKRSTGVGFSRKENLHEHLRRVHRGAGSDRLQTTPVPSEGSRKRKRVSDETNNDDGEETEDLNTQIKKLKQKLEEKDERLWKLEQMVETLVRGAQPAQMGSEMVPQNVQPRESATMQQLRAAQQVPQPQQQQQQQEQQPAQVRGLGPGQQQRHQQLRHQQQQQQ